MKWKTALVGFGQMAAGYSDDAAHARWHRHPTHAAALRDHAKFDWVAVVDPSEPARERARHQWNVTRVVANARELAGDEIDVAVLATPPSERLSVVEALPTVRAVIVEKPLAATVDAARRFLDRCRQRNILVAVNLPRRYDADLTALASGRLTELCGRPQAVFATYGNGLRNNGTHLIDTIRMLFGEIAQHGVVPGARAFREGPISDDLNVPFYLVSDAGVTILAQPLRFAGYREVGLDIWGERGRLELLLEGLIEIFTPVQPNRQLTGANEIAHDRSERRLTSFGGALQRVYDNVDAALTGSAPLACSGEEALATLEIVERLMAVTAAHQ